MHECFALREGCCTVLVVSKCQGEDCPFSKTAEQFDQGQQQALERIQSLEPDRRAYLMGKYGLQTEMVSRSGSIETQRRDAHDSGAQTAAESSLQVD